LANFADFAKISLILDADCALKDPDGHLDLKNEIRSPQEQCARGRLLALLPHLSASAARSCVSRYAARRERTFARSYENHFIPQVCNDEDAPSRGSAGTWRKTGGIPFARRSNEERGEGACCGASRQTMDDPRDAERWGSAPDLRPSCAFELPSCPDAALMLLKQLCGASTFSILSWGLDASLHQQDGVKGTV